MKGAAYQLGIFIVLIIFSHPVLPQVPEKKGFVRSTITVEKLKKAQTIDELIVNFPEGYEVVHYRISIAGKDLKKLEEWKPDNVKNVLNNTFQIVEAGWRVCIEYIQVKRKGSDSKPVHLQPQELVVID